MKKKTGYEMLGKRMKECRLELGLSTEEAAGILGLKPSMYLRYEAGEKDVRYDILLALAHMFHVSCDYLMGLSDEKWPYFDERP